MAGSVRVRRLRMGVVGCAFASLGVLGVACSSAQGSNARPTDRSTASSRVSLDESDSGRTVDVHVPATITVTLPYVPSAGKVWELESGGAGFSEVGSPLFHAPRSAGGTGTEVLSFKMTSRATIPIVIDEALPGPLGAGARRFSVTIHGL